MHDVLVLFQEEVMKYTSEWTKRLNENGEEVNYLRCVMTPEQFDMIKRLQPLFKKKMGDIISGDEIVNQFSLNNPLTTFVTANGQCGLDNCSRIPKPIDWQNPERGLWGMIDSKKDISEANFTLDKHNKVHLLFFKNGVACEIFAQDLFTALLKALCEQEGV
jgi:hypothetical protein